MIQGLELHFTIIYSYVSLFLQKKQKKSIVSKKKHDKIALK